MGNACAGNEQSKGPEVEKVQTPAANPEPVVEESPPPPQEEPAPGEPKLTLTIVGARGVRESDWLPGAGKPDCYCEVKTGDKVLFTTKIIDNTCEPVWFETCEVNDIEDAAPTLEFHVWDKDTIGSDFLGKATLKSEDYDGKGFNGELELAESKVKQAYIKVKVKVAGVDLPPGPPAEFEVPVEKKDAASYGLDLDTQGVDQLYVLEVKEGPFMEYNKDKEKEVQVKKGDVIIKANGKTSIADMLDQFKTTTKVDCVIRRTVLTSIVFDRGETSVPLGFKVPEKPQGEFLQIKEIIPEGAAQKHNDACKDPMAKLIAGDRIFSVGSVRGKGPKLLETLLTKGGKTMLTVVRVAKTQKEKKEEGEGEEQGEGLMHWMFG